MQNKIDKIKAVMIGHAVADALGVPVEFCSRDELKKQPVTDMMGYGTYPVPAGSWSDDTSMSIAALDSLASGKFDANERDHAKFRKMAGERCVYAHRGVL